MAAWVASHERDCTDLTVEGDRGVESLFLQRRVHCEPDFLRFMVIPPMGRKRNERCVVSLALDGAAGHNALG